MAEATDSDESATIPREPFVRSHEETTQDPRSPHSSQQKVEDDEVTVYVKKMNEDCGDGASPPPEYCISKVPHVLRRNLDEVDYTPIVVSVGPFHHDNAKLQETEKHKLNVFKSFTRRVGSSGSSLDDLVRLVKRLELKVRASYSETISLTEHELVTLTLTDAGFIIELFIMHLRWDYELDKDANSSLASIGPYICEDLLLLENQLPFFVIEELFNKAFPHDSRGSLPSFRELTYNYFDHLNVGRLKPNDDVKINHFTDLLRFFYLQGKTPTRKKAGRHILRFNANELQEKGIKFEVSESKCLLDMKISGNILKIPHILVDDNFKLLFRNMIALELSYYPYQAYISDYVHILDSLIDTSKDVDILVNKKIVTSYLGDSNNVTSLVNGLGGNVTQWDFNSEYLGICEKLNEYSQEPWTWIGMKATLRREYCRTPWKIIASIAGAVVILLTVVQTVISILQVEK